MSAGNGATVAIMQPTYLPWPGYFSLILESDTFIFLDDVKLEKSSWHVRNKVPVNSQEKYITITLHASRLGTIKSSLLSTNHPWRKKHVKMLTNIYNKAPFGKEVLAIVIPIVQDTQFRALADFNIEIISRICEYLNIKVTMFRSSNMNIDGSKSQRLINFCKKINATTYLSPLGAKEYIEEEGLFSSSKLIVKYQNFKSINYNQFNTDEFLPYLSIIDLIANLGKEKTLIYLKNNL